MTTSRNKGWQDRFSIIHIFTDFEGQKGPLWSSGLTSCVTKAIRLYPLIFALCWIICGEIKLCSSNFQNWFQFYTKENWNCLGSGLNYISSRLNPISPLFLFRIFLAPDTSFWHGFNTQTSESNTTSGTLRPKSSHLLGSFRRSIGC